MDNELFGTISTIILVVSGLITPAIFFCNFRENRKIRRFQTEPEIIIKIQMSADLSGIYDFIIRNEGNGYARNVKINYKGDSSIFINIGEDPKIHNLPSIKKGISYMDPKSEIKYSIGYLKNGIQQKKWEFIVNYESKYKKQNSVKSEIDLSYYQGTID